MHIRQKKIILKGIIPGVVYSYDFDWLKHVVTKPTPLSVANPYPPTLLPITLGKFMQVSLVPWLFLMKYQIL